MTIKEILSTTLLLVDGAIVVVLVPRIIIQRRDSAATLAWVFFILLLPLGGAFCYHFFGTRRMRLRQQRRAQIRQALTPEQERLDAALVTFRPPEDEDEESLAEIDRTEATVGNEVQVLQHGDLTFRSIEEAIRAAKSYVHVEFYIFHPDATGMGLIDAMVERARAGVEVRLLVDAVGARDLRLRGLGAAPLLAAGGKFAEFLPVSLITRPFQRELPQPPEDRRGRRPGGLHRRHERRRRVPRALGGVRQLARHPRPPARPGGAPAPGDLRRGLGLCQRRILRR